MRRPFGRILVQAVFTSAVLAGILGLAVYAVPHTGPNWAYGSEDVPTPVGEETEEPLAMPPGLDAAPGVPDEPENEDSSQDTERSGDSSVEGMRAWAESLSAVDVDSRALMAYGNAEMRLAEEKPDCALSWTTLAGIGSVETNHGTTGGTSLDQDGFPKDPIRGPALDGTNDNKEILDTDDGLWDDDTTYDRAVGPMQFIPSTWERWQIDGDGDGVADPNDIDDVAVAAGYYLCADGRDMSHAEDWYAGVFSYNHMDSYVMEVYQRADAYGQASNSG